ncbi:YheE family protein [Paenibacillus endoradicis]|uniref:YheE family protein n=1 Tax=Paenibacillus endoradicis TaxID=2972487 RepID=UPI002158D665|nr:YheE family protein [Paenibacillus endoradicis]MCR8659793.1 YheE family protein [Paenibacillus endoradicis]
MFEKFDVKVSLDDTVNCHWHFTTEKDGINYNGHYDGGEIYWLQPMPEENLKKQMEEKIHQLMAEYQPLDSEMR